MQKKLSDEGYGTVASEVAKIVGKCYKKENILNETHNEIFEILKPILTRYKKN